MNPLLGWLSFRRYSEPSEGVRHVFLTGSFLFISVSLLLYKLLERTTKQPLPWIGKKTFAFAHLRANVETIWKSEELLESAYDEVLPPFLCVCCADTPSNSMQKKRSHALHPAFKENGSNALRLCCIF